MIDSLRNKDHLEGLTDAQEGLALSLHDAGVILFNFNEGFVLKSGLVSPIYIDLRRIQSFPDSMDAATGALIEQTKGLEFDRIAGIPEAAVPMATLVANRLRKPQITPRKDTKTHGIIRKIDGVFLPGETALVLDDLITTGASKFEAVDVLKENGLLVKDVVVVIDRQQCGEQKLAEKGLVLHAALKIKPTLQL